MAETRSGELLVGYAFVLAGGLAHVAVSALKEARGGKPKGSVALADFAQWVHVREMDILVAICSFWVGLIGMAFRQNRVDWQTAFFVGYGIDSFIDLFLQRFDKMVTAKTSAARDKLRA